MITALWVRLATIARSRASCSRRASSRLCSVACWWASSRRRRSRSRLSVIARRKRALQGDDFVAAAARLGRPPAPWRTASAMARARKARSGRRQFERQQAARQQGGGERKRGHRARSGTASPGQAAGRPPAPSGRSARPRSAGARKCVADHPRGPALRAQAEHHPRPERAHGGRDERKDEQGGDDAGHGDRRSPARAAGQGPAGGK